MIKNSETFSELFCKIPAKQILSRDFLLLRYRVALPNESYKIGIVVGKKLFKRAVDRNLLKRRIREAIRLNAKIIEPANGLELIVVYRSRKIHEFKEIYETINNLFLSLSGRLDSNL